MAHPHQTAPSTSCRGYALLGLATVVIGIGGFGTWAGLARLDAAAIAPGNVTVETSRRPVQHLEGGLVSAILVRENARVRKGQILFRLTSERLSSELASVSAKLDQALMRRARLVQQRDGGSVLSLPTQLSENATAVTTQRLFRSEQALLEANVRALRGQLEQLEAKRAEIERTLPGLRARQRSLTYEIDSLTSEIDRVSVIAKRGFYPRNKLSQMRRTLARLTGNRDYISGELERQDAARGVINAEIARTKSDDRQRISQELSQTELEVISLQSQKRSLSEQMSRITVRAASDGVIQAIQPKSVGDVVKPGETIAEIVPANETLRVVARVKPVDIDNVKAGGSVQVRVGAFSASQTQPLSGDIVSVSADTLRDEATGEPYFKVNISLAKREIPATLLNRLVPGMPADIIVAKGERTVLQYLLDPLLNAFAKSFREA
jgi:HlyD family type I secretion membrane fusion protein